MFGRREIYTDAEEITEENIVSVLNKALPIHRRNRAEIAYLWDYYKGRQPILRREKSIRPEIKNTVVENRAYQIVSFKTGYLLGEPIQYVNASADEGKVEAVKRLNAYMLAEDKAAGDMELGEWMHIAGVGYRMVLPDKPHEADEAPFEVYTLDPRCTFLVRWSGIGHKVVLNCHCVRREDGSEVYSCYTPNRYYEIVQGRVVDTRPNPLGLPIVEYPLNRARLGEFEIVLPLLDAINSTESNRLDGVEQFIQALMLFHNVDISAEDFAALKELGGIKYRDVDANTRAEVKYLTAELNQTQTQALMDNLYDTVLTICGMPNRNGGSSTSDTGSAVIMRDGWSDAEARAQRTESQFKRSEKEFLKLVLKICGDTGRLDLKLSDIGIQFTRRNYENIAEKANVLITMLSSDKIAPQLAFDHCGMFSDSAAAYAMSKRYYEAHQPQPEVIANGQRAQTSPADRGGDPGHPGDPEPRQQRGDQAPAG